MRVACEEDAMPITIETVRLPEAEIPTAGRVLGRAFWDDPMFIYVVPDDEHRTRALPPFFAAAARYGHLFGEVYTTAGTVEGGAVWIPPDSGEMTPERMAATGLSLVAEHLGEEAMARFFHALQHFDELHKRDMPSSHWYLMILGVDPPRQGLGIGGQLIQPVLARADAAGLPCYLETTKARNVPFYQKHGFAVVVEDDLPGGGPHYWTMRRPPRA